tara:strand:+ start:564 stop:851 length:288 start_codon:yes stop_codon:yes gene_type:complete
MKHLLISRIGLTASAALVGLAIGVSLPKQSDQSEYELYYKIGESITNIQDMKEWMHEDINQGVIDSAYGSYYVEYLNQTEDLLIELVPYRTNTIK